MSAKVNIVTAMTVLKQVPSLITAHPSKSVVPDESKKAQLRRHRQVERQARRRRRKDTRQKEGVSPYQHHEGLSTDDEEKESDKQSFVQQMGEYVYCRSCVGCV